MRFTREKNFQTRFFMLHTRLDRFFPLEFDAQLRVWTTIPRMQRDQPKLLSAFDWVSFQSTDQPELQLLLWALFAGNCVRVGENLKVRCCWPGTGVFWGGQLWASGCAYLVPFSGPVDVDTGVADSPGCRARPLLPVGLVPGTPAWGLGLPTFFGVGDAWKLLCFIRAFCRRFSTSWCLCLPFGAARDLDKFRDCHTYVEERGIWSQISGLVCVLHPWLVCAFLCSVPQSSLMCKMK